MLTDKNVHEINKQIERELRVVNSFVSDNEDKAAALDRIAKLEQLITPPQPSRRDILTELADALVDKARREQHLGTRDICIALANALSR